MSTSARVRLLVITCIALFMAMLDSLILGVSLPSIQKDLGASMSDLEWFMNAYTLAFAVLIIPFSLLGESIGRKKVFLAGVAVFTIGSLFSGLSTSSSALIVFRTIQGIGGAAIVPLSLTLVNAAFPPAKRALAIGLWSGISGLGLSVGPLVGGLVMEGAPWQMIFYINLPVGLIALLLGLSWIKESRGVRKPLDPLGVLLLTIGLFGLIFGLEKSRPLGWGDPLVIMSLLVGLLLLVLFYYWEKRRTNPTVQFDLFRNKTYTAYILAGFWMNASVFGAIFMLTLFLQQAQGYSPLEAGVREMAWTIMTMLAAPFAGMAIGKFGSKRVLMTGLLLQGVGLSWLAFMVSIKGPEFPFTDVLVPMMLAGAGMGLSFTPLSHGLLASVPEDSAGEASGVSNTTRQLGSVFGIAISGIIFGSGASMESPQQFANHLVPSLAADSLMMLIALLVIAIFVFDKRNAAVVSTKASHEKNL